MPIRTFLERVAQDYPAASSEPLKDHEFADFMRREGPDALRSAGVATPFVTTASPGQGNWAEVPWLGVFNPEVTTSATRGLYVVYLFSADMRKLFLCQGQGVTHVRREFGAGTHEELLRRAALIRARLPEHARRFRDGPISLGGHTPLAKDYDMAVAYYREYRTTELPSEADLRIDLREAVGLYSTLIARGGVDSLETALLFADDEVPETSAGSTGVVEWRRYTRHRRIERNSSVSKKVKRALGYVCQACGFDFETAYGDRGRRYIEAHHLVPLHSLPEDEPVPMDPESDFAVLCSNCHRMVHRRQPMLALHELRALVEAET